MTFHRNSLSGYKSEFFYFLPILLIYILVGTAMQWVLVAPTASSALLLQLLFKVLVLQTSKNYIFII